VRLLLSREAKLFDSPLFIIKSFMSILTGYLLLHNHYIIGKDMISVLFGIMIALEPVSVSGFKSGFSQIEASIIGGTITALIIYIGGINYITVPLSVALTIYVTLIMDWKNLSIIAIFTAIYMTQYVQLNSMNEVSVILTFRLRMLAVFSGVTIAVIYNYIFSKLFYKSLVKKRTIYLFEKLINNFKNYLNEDLDFESLKYAITSTFVDVDLIRKNIIDLQKERKESELLEKYRIVVMEIRNLNHFFMDIILNGELVNDIEIKEVIFMLEKIIKSLENGNDNFKCEINKNIENENMLKINYALINIIKMFEEVNCG
jgi:hypothetical protein